jgi:hypothetical protein
MRNMHPITLLAFILFGAVALAQVSYIASGPHGVTPTPHVAKLEVQPAPGPELRNEVQVAAATPNHAPHRSGPKPGPAVETAAASQPDPLSLATKPQPAVDAVASLIVATEPVQNSAGESAAVESAAVESAAVESAAVESAAVATPNHDPEHRRATPSFALDPVTLQADPEPATSGAAAIATSDAAAPGAAAPASPAPATVAFVAADTALYAKGNARLRAAPSTSAEILAKLAADAPLRAIARSSDGAWWKVSLKGGRTGYVHRNVVSKTRMVEIEPTAASMPVIAVAATPPRRNDGLLGYVDQTMNWFVDTAGRGKAPTTLRPER